MRPSAAAFESPVVPTTMHSTVRWADQAGFPPQEAAAIRGPGGVARAPGINKNADDPFLPATKLPRRSSLWAPTCSSWCRHSLLVGLAAHGLRQTGAVYAFAIAAFRGPGSFDDLRSRAFATSAGCVTALVASER